MYVNIPSLFALRTYPFLERGLSLNVLVKAPSSSELFCASTEQILLSFYYFLEFYLLIYLFFLLIHFFENSLNTFHHY